MEKAGIIKENSKLIVGERNEKTDQVFINKAKDTSGDINQIILKLKTLWKDLNQQEKDKIWDYFNLLLKLSDKISTL